MVELKVRSTVVDLLSQNEGRFAKLEVCQNLTLAPTLTRLPLPSNYNTISRKCVEVDVNGKLVKKIFVTSEADYFDRAANEETNLENLAYVKWLPDDPDGRGWYFYLGDTSDVVRYFRFFYYRICTSDDADLINNTEIVKTGAKAKLPSINAEYQTDLTIYMSMRGGFAEHAPQTMETDLHIEPATEVKAHNLLMNTIGGGG
jgi:hypothetical protein